MHLSDHFIKIKELRQSVVQQAMQLARAELRAEAATSLTNIDDAERGRRTAVGYAAAVVTTGVAAGMIAAHAGPIRWKVRHGWPRAVAEGFAIVSASAGEYGCQVPSGARCEK